jgi:RHS repeat-associated protein
VLAGDTLASIASGIASALTADSALQGIGVSASVVGKVITLQSNSVNQTILRETTSATATETLALNIPVNGIQTAVIGGTKTTGDTITITVYDAGLPGGLQSITYTVLMGDTLTSIATGLAAAITANANLAAIGISATQSSTVINVLSKSINATTYAAATSVSATETLSLTQATGVSQYGYNNVNELTGIVSGGFIKVEGSTNKALKSAAVNGAPAAAGWSKNFNGSAPVSPGGNILLVSATDGANNVLNRNYQININGPITSTFTFDATGNMLTDGSKTYVWDAENRLVQIIYPGLNNYSKFTYDALGNRTVIEETSSAIVSSVKQFVGNEERDSAGVVKKIFFTHGQLNASTKLFFGKDHLGSLRSFTDNTGVVQRATQFSAFGKATQLSGTSDGDFGFSGLYQHDRSGLNFSIYRAYSSELGRFLNRDPIAETGGVNLFAYVINNPISFTDITGLQKDKCEKCPDPPNKMPPDPDFPVPYPNAMGGQTYFYSNGVYVTVRPGGSYIIHYADGYWVYCDENGNLLHRVRNLHPEMPNLGTPTVPGPNHPSVPTNSGPNPPTDMNGNYLGGPPDAPGIAS